MSASRTAVALAAAFFASTASVWPPHEGTRAPDARADHHAAASLPAARVLAQTKAETVWPPPGVKPSTTPADVAARLELTATGAHRLVIEKPGTFVHVGYREVAAAGPDWAAIELRAGDRAPKDDVAVWESTDPSTLATTRGVVRFSLARGAKPEATVAEAPRPGPRDTSKVRDCRAHDDGESGFAVVCRITMETSGVRAIRPASLKPLAGAWVWDVPRLGKAPAARFVRIDLPLSAGGAEAGAIAYVHGIRGVVVRAEATWPSRDEAPALLFTETSRAQPTSPTFTWAAPRRRPGVR